MVEEPPFSTNTAVELVTPALEVEIMLHRTARDPTLLPVHIDAVFSAFFPHMSPFMPFETKISPTADYDRESLLLCNIYSLGICPKSGRQYILLLFIKFRGSWIACGAYHQAHILLS